MRLSSVRQGIAVFFQHISIGEETADPFALAYPGDCGCFYALTGQLAFKGREQSKDANDHTSDGC
ncbi:MAG: hypothetical protein Q7K71_05495 [Candidatus Omnitrophota bacterium]|nr:hypothetical protein [Candidatus Omnitrophota bacterium]